MTNAVPPRFVPTLTEKSPSLTPTTAIEDGQYFERKDPSDSMLDLDLGDLDGPITRIEQVSPLGAYQGGQNVNPMAVNHVPVNTKSPPMPRVVAAPPVMPPRPAPASVTQQAAPAVQRPVAAPPVVPRPTLQSMLPPEWQAQLQQAVQQAVRQELQQQMPFLLLQWSKQIEDKLTPHIHQQLLKLVVSWGNPPRS